MADPEKQSELPYDSPKTAIFLVVLHSWQTLLSSYASLSRQYLATLASSNGVTFTTPSDLNACRADIVAALAGEDDISVERLITIERQHVFISRLNSLWNIAWLNGLPALLVIPWALERVPDTFATHGTIAGIMVSVFAVFSFLLIAYISIFIQLVLSPVYLVIANRIVGVSKAS